MTCREYYILLLEELIKTRLKIVDIPKDLLSIKTIAINEDFPSNKSSRQQIQILEDLCQNLQEQIQNGKITWMDKVISLDGLLENKSI